MSVQGFGMGKGLMKHMFKNMKPITATPEQAANMSWGQSQAAFNNSAKAPSVVAAQNAFLASKSVEAPVQILNTKRAPKANPKYQRKNRRANRKSRKQSRRANRKTRRH